MLVSFSTGFTSTGDDAVNAERVTEIGRVIQKKLNKLTFTNRIDSLEKCIYTIGNIEFL